MYLALDQSLNITGYAFFDAEANVLDTGIFVIKPNRPIEQRLSDIWENLNQITKNKNIEYIFIEDIQYQNNKDTYKKLAYVQAAIFLWCYWNDIKFSILAPSHWRKIITDNYGIKFGRSRAEQKQSCYDFIIKKWNLSQDKVTEDMADAIALGMAGIIEKDSNTNEW